MRFIRFQTPPIPSVEPTSPNHLAGAGSLQSPTFWHGDVLFRTERASFQKAIPSRTGKRKPLHSDLGRDLTRQCLVNQANSPIAHVANMKMSLAQGDATILFLKVIHLAILSCQP